MINYYKILGVSNFATTEEIKSAFRKLSKKFHPDVNDGDEFFANKFRELKEAYDFLSDDAKRESLDLFLKSNTGSYYNNEEIKRKREEQEFKARHRHEHEERERQRREYDEKIMREKRESKVTVNNNSEEKKGILKYYFTPGVIGAFIVLCIYKCSNFNNKSNSEYVIEETIDDDNEIETDNNFSEEYSEPTHDEGSSYSMENINDIIAERQRQRAIEKQYSIGATMNKVKESQGTPTSVHTLMDYEIWFYEQSSVKFKNGILIEYNNRSGNLYIK